MGSIGVILAGAAAILIPLLVAGALNIHRFFRCPHCGHVDHDAYVLMALLPFGLVVPGLLVPLIGPPIVIVIMAVKPGWLLNFEVSCSKCAEAPSPAGAVGSAAMA